MISVKSRLGFLRIIIALFLFVPPAYPQTGNDAWNDYAADPYAHANIPNNAYAGYRGGRAEIPDVPVVVDVTDFGGIGNDATDNTEAFKAAILAAWREGGGAVYIPPGTYVVERIIHLRHDGVVLRGAGKDVTTIKFINNLDDALTSFNTGSGGTNWFWQGGLLWISPAAQISYNFSLELDYGGVDYGSDTGKWWQEEPSGKF